MERAYSVTGDEMAICTSIRVMGREDGVRDYKFKSAAIRNSKYRFGIKMKKPLNLPIGGFEPDGDHPKLDKAFSPCHLRNCPGTQMTDCYGYLKRGWDLKFIPQRLLRRPTVFQSEAAAVQFRVDPNTV